MGHLHKYISDEELCRIIAASSFKRKKMYSAKKGKQTDGKQKEELPEFVYVF